MVAEMVWLDERQPRSEAERTERAQVIDYFKSRLHGRVHIKRIVSVQRVQNGDVGRTPSRSRRSWRVRRRRRLTSLRQMRTLISRVRSREMALPWNRRGHNAKDCAAGLQSHVLRQKCHGVRQGRLLCEGFVVLGEHDVLAAER